MKRMYIFMMFSIFITGCASTSSVMVNHSTGTPKIAIMPLQGVYGNQASDLIAEQFALNGIPTIDRAHMGVMLRENGFRGNDMFNQESLPRYGRLLGVKKIFTGTITTSRGGFSSYPHAFITIRLIDVSTGKVTWIGRYGNTKWSSAISTQGDIQRGARDIVQEFIKVHGKNL